MWIDSHAHLFEYSPEEIPQLLQEASIASVSTIISTATSLENANAVLEHCSRYDTVYGAAGISPFDAGKVNSGWAAQLRSLLKNSKMIAVGEIGIDRSNPGYPDPEHQISLFEEQLSIAVELNLPAVVHSRGAESETADICKRMGVKKALFHCFTGDRNSMRKIVDYGYFISFSGIITFKSAAVRDLVPEVPADRLLIETDSPYLAPVPFRGKKNHPAWVKYTGEEMARLMERESEEMQTILKGNFQNLFF